MENEPMIMEKIKTDRFISFEGIDYSGKTTQIDLLKSFLEGRGFNVFVIREPGGTAISEKIRQLLLDKKNFKMYERAELFLYSAARVQLVVEKIIPMLKKDFFVIADRYVDSTTAYQGYGRRIDLKVIKQINKAATFDIMPNITFYLEIKPGRAYERRNDSAKQTDRLEAAGLEFYKRVFNGYKKISQKNKSFYVLDAEQSVETIHKQILNIITPKIMD